MVSCLLPMPHAPIIALPCLRQSCRLAMPIVPRTHLFLSDSTPISTPFPSLSYSPSFLPPRFVLCCVVFQDGEPGAPSTEAHGVLCPGVRRQLLLAPILTVLRMGSRFTARLDHDGPRRAETCAVHLLGACMGLLLLELPLLCRDLGVSPLRSIAVSFRVRPRRHPRGGVPVDGGIMPAQGAGKGYDHHVSVKM